jgi:ATP-binding cassette subfamily F protein 3
MLSITNLDFHFGGRTMYEDANLHVKPKDRIGLIGLNGTGKSTLLRLIVGEYQPDGGQISKAKDCSIGFLNQDLLSYQSDEPILHVAMQAFERALEVEKKLEHVLEQMEANYSDELLNELTKLQEEYERLDGYTIQAKAEEILEGLGFSTEELHKPLRQFSGGWRMRVMLAKLLLQKPDLLLLDEPTNHLDLPSIQWIEEYLDDYEGAYIIVSHDRYFLDRCTDITVEVAQHKLNYYAGNYSFYLEEKALRNEIQKGAFENQQAKIRQTERFINRFKAKASKARQVQSRVKMLERMELVSDVIDENARVHFKFNFNTASGKLVMNLENVSKAFGDKVILRNSNAVIERGDKIALIGANGRGKSTLLRIIGNMEPCNGKVTAGHNVKTAFFAQHQLESLTLTNSILDELKQMGTSKLESELRTILGCFLFSGDDVFKPIKVLSGGEKSRVALAKTLLSDANFLLLDEPTNHLDMQSVNILIQALQQYQGTFVVVSHDRYFVSEIANKIWYIENQEIKEYPGNFEEYEYWLETNKGKAQELPPQPAKAEKENKTLPSASLNGTEKKVDKSKQDFKKQIQAVEADITRLEAEINQLEAEMSKPEIFANHNKLFEFQQKHEALATSLNAKTMEWEQLINAMDE